MSDNLNQKDVSDQQIPEMYRAKNKALNHPSIIKLASSNTDQLDHKLVFPGNVLAKLPPNGVEDNLLLAPYKDVDFEVSTKLSSGKDATIFSPGDLVQLILDGKLVGNQIGIKPSDLYPIEKGDPFKIPFPSVLRQIADGEHTLSYQVHYYYGGGVSEAPPVKFIIDTVAPGSPHLAALEIDPNIINNGLVPEDYKIDADGNKYLSTTIPGYFGMALGDIISLRINEQKQSEGQITITSIAAATIELRFPQKVLEAFKDGQLKLAYSVQDRAMNTEQVAYSVTVQALLNGYITDLDLPIVKTAVSDQIDYQDAIKPVTVTIPGNAKIKAGDEIILSFDGKELDPVPTLVDGDAASPLFDIPVPFEMIYDRWYKFTHGQNQWAPLEFQYKVKRKHLVAGTSGSKNVDTNINVPAGNPGDKPVHQYLAPPALQTNSTVNRVVPDDLEHDAFVIINWFNTEQPEEPVFLVGDTLTITLGADKLPPKVITADDYSAQQRLKITVNPDFLKKMTSGSQQCFYEISRSLADGRGRNTVKSPSQSITVQGVDSLPGGGSLLPGYFTPLNAQSALGPKEVESGQVAFNINVYKNQNVGDTITLSFARFKRSYRTDGEVAIVNTAHTMSINVMSQSKPAIFFLKKDDLYEPRELTHAIATYTVKNSVGTVKSAESFVIVDTRGENK